MKFDVDDKNRCRLVCVKFHLNRCRFAMAVAKCLGGSLFWDSVLYSSQLSCLSYFGKLLFFTVENLSISARFSFITVIHCLPCRNTKSHEISLVVTFC